MRILFLGDVVSEPGCEFVRRKLPGYKRMQEIDFCVVNGENSAKGNGITPLSAEHLLTSGADLLTTGNHVFKQPAAARLLEEGTLPVIRPANLHRSAPGMGVWVLEKRGLRLGVVNMLGRVNMEQAEDPFDCADACLREMAAQGVVNVLIDFHAEATSEKLAMAWYLDGRLSALWGTHTHVQTGDARVFPQGTGYITDLGMTGPRDSVLGITPEQSVRMFLGYPRDKYTTAPGPVKLEGAVFTVDTETGRCLEVRPVRLEE